MSAALRGSTYEKPGGISLHHLHRLLFQREHFVFPDLRSNYSQKTRYACVWRSCSQGCADRRAQTTEWRWREGGWGGGGGRERAAGGRHRPGLAAPEEDRCTAPRSKPWLTGRKGLSGSAEPTLATAMVARSHLLDLGCWGSRQPRVLRRKGRLLEGAARRRQGGPFGAGALGAGAGSGRVPGAPAQRLPARMAAWALQVTWNSKVGAPGDVLGAEREEARGYSRDFCTRLLTTSSAQ